MSLYAWKYDGDNTVVYTKSEEPSTGSIVCDSNGVEYGEFELHLLYNGEIDSALNPYINKISTDPETFLTRLRFYTKTVDTDISLLVFFNRYVDGDIFPISRLKHNGVTYAIVDEKARTDIETKQDALPSQSGNSGKFLTTNGTSVSWGTVDALPDQTSQSGKYLTTNGTTASWANVDALPSQTGQSGKYLTTDGSSASWATVQAGPKFLSFTNVTASSWVSDNTYTGYYYKCDVTCNGVTSSDYAQVIFAPDQSNSGNYASACSTGTNTVTIYSKVSSSITIPTIIVMGA